MQIRPATLADVPDLHRLVAELADYVGESSKFKATIPEYQKDFQEGHFRALVAEVDGHIAGMALYFMAYSTWMGRMLYLEDFVLEPSYRRRGIGQKLWDGLKETGRAEGCKLLKWQVINSNSEAIKFYEAQGATMEHDWIDGKLYL